MKVVVLNKVWQPICVVESKKAVLLLCRGTAKAVEPSTYEVFDLEEWLSVPTKNGNYMQAVRFKFPIPEAVLLLKYSKFPKHSTSFSKRKVFSRDGFTCQYCGRKLDELTLDHVVPKSKGGKTIWENVVAACKKCNNKKGNQPVGKKFKLKKKPEPPEESIVKLAKEDIWKKLKVNG